jgi:Flp pilus assembly pilin Flp
MSWQLITRALRLKALRDDGQDLIEYGMLGALISVFAIGAVQALGRVIKTSFWDVVANLL